MRQFAKDDDWEIRQAVAEVLRKDKQAEGIELLLDLVADEDPDVTEIALKSARENLGEDPRIDYALLVQGHDGFCEGLLERIKSYADPGKILETYAQNELRERAQGGCHSDFGRSGTSTHC